MPSWIVVKLDLLINRLAHSDILGSFLMFVPLMIFFLVSRRFNARLEAPCGTPWLPRLANALLAKKNPTKIRRKLAENLLRVHLLLYKQLKLLPDAQTGRCLNFFLMLYICWIVPVTSNFVLTKSKLVQLSVFFEYRNNLATLSPAEALFVIFILCVFAIMPLLPFFFLRKNREIYFDLVVLFVFLQMTWYKLFYCTIQGCCYGILWTGPGAVYSDRINAMVFPVQIVEVVVGVLCFILCALYMLYAKSYKPGRGCSLSVLSYAVTRFFIYFFRYHGEGYRSGEAAMLFGLSVPQIICIVAAILAIVWWFILPLEKRLVDRAWLFAARHLCKRKPKSVM